MTITMAAPMDEIVDQTTLSVNMDSPQKNEELSSDGNSPSKSDCVPATDMSAQPPVCATTADNPNSTPAVGLPPLKGPDPVSLDADKNDIFKVPTFSGFRVAKTAFKPQSLKSKNNQSISKSSAVTELQAVSLQCNEDMEGKQSFKLSERKGVPNDSEESHIPAVTVPVGPATNEFARDPPKIDQREALAPKSTASRSAGPSPDKAGHDKSLPLPLPYKEPLWSGIPDETYALEVLKGGLIVDRVDLSDRPFTVFGRLSSCHVPMEHPSISRHHAVVQHRAAAGDDAAAHPAGLYLYDLGSTHGTQLNKNLVKSHCYYRLRVGHMIKFGGSSRTFIVQGPDEDAEPESELTVTELRERRREEEERHRKLEETEVAAKEAEIARKSKEESDGVNWGMGEDATEEDDLEHNPFALEAPTINEEVYLDDPKKTLRGWFEREGYELEYEIEEKGTAHFLCKVQLPLDTPSGSRFYAEASVKGKKKEAVVACALEACRILDRRGVLRQATHESRERKLKNWEEDDYYDSDEDTYLDQTGTIEKKRQQRIQKAGKTGDSVETYDSLLEKHLTVLREVQEIESTLRANEQRAAAETTNESGDQDELDAYMASIQSSKSVVDKRTKTRLKLRLAQLKLDEARLRKLVNIAKPASLPPLQTIPLGLRFPAKLALKIKSPADPAILDDSAPTVSRSKPKVTDEPMDLTPVKSKLKGPSLPPKLFSEVASKLSKPVDTVEDKKQSVSLETKDTTANESSTEDVPPPVATQSGSQSFTLNDVIDGDFDSADDRSLCKRKDTRDRKAIKRAKEKEKYVYDVSDPNYAMWLPPDDQSGDGKTSLNDKFGY